MSTDKFLLSLQQGMQRLRLEQEIRQNIVEIVLEATKAIDQLDLGLECTVEYIQHYTAFHPVYGGSLRVGVQRKGSKRENTHLFRILGPKHEHVDFQLALFLTDDKCNIEVNSLTTMLQGYFSSSSVGSALLSLSKSP